jgi:S1-C subfamily serine protease
MMARILCLLLLVRLAEADAQAKAPSAAEQAACEATVQINCKNKLGIGVVGSGVVIATTKDSETNVSTTFALTARHVIDDAKEIKVTAIVSGAAAPFKEAEVVWRDEFGRSDLALVSFSSANSKIRAAVLGKREKYLEDFPIFKTSWRDGARPIFREDKAIKRALVREPDERGLDQRKGTAFFWQTKGTSNEGESGGGMFSMDGMLLGICSGNRLEVGYFAHRDEIYWALWKITRQKHNEALKSALPWLE